jgi:hypothetical protein
MAKAAEGKNLGGRPRTFDTVEDMQRAIDRYFKSCERRDDDGNLISIRPVTIEGLAFDCGCDRHTIWDYKKKVDINGEPFWPVIKVAIDRAQVSLAEHAMTAKNPAGAIWLGCNNYDYVQKTESHVTQESTVLSKDQVDKFLHKGEHENENEGEGEGNNDAR